MTRSEEDAAAERRLQAQLAACLRVVDQATSQLQGLRGRVGPVRDDVMRVIGGTAQGTDAEMVASLDRAQVALDGAVMSCAHARAVGRGVR